MFDQPSATIYRFPVAEKPNLTASSSATEETGSVPTAPAAVAATDTKESPRGFLQMARRNLKEEELDSPAARRFLIAEIERLDLICTESRHHEINYHDQRVVIAILTESGKRSVSKEILSTLCISVGFAGLGAAPNYLAIAGVERFAWIVIGLAVVLIAGGIATKAWK